MTEPGMPAMPCKGWLLAGALLLAAGSPVRAGPAGAGFFITADGYFVTSYEIVADAEPILIRDGGGRMLPALIVALDPGSGLALLKAEGVFSALPLAASGALRAGDRVFTLKPGSVEAPAGGWTLEEGAVSGKTEGAGTTGVLRVSISAGPVESGAPLLDADGNAVGIVAPAHPGLPKPAGGGSYPRDGYAIGSESLVRLLQGEQPALAQLLPAGARRPSDSVPAVAEIEPAIGMVFSGAPEPATAQPDQGELVVTEMFRLGNRARREQDYQSARVWFLEAAMRGYAPAQTALAELYQNGQGVPRDDAEAVRWYREAALQREPEAQARLGWMYARGTGVARDDDEALGWFRRAAEEGSAAGQNGLGVMYRDGRGVYRDDAAAAAWFQRAALKGDAAAQDNAGVMFRDGRGVEQDAAEAAWLFRRAAEQRNAEAETHLGLMYREGRGVPRDEAEAVRWFRRAAEQGHALAEYYLGVSYAEGRGISRSRADAAAWLNKSAGQGLSLAQDYLRGLEK